MSLPRSLRQPHVLVEVELEKTASEEDNGNTNFDPGGRLSASVFFKTSVRHACTI